MIDRSLFTLPGAGKIMGMLLVLGIIQGACVLGQAFGLAGAIDNLWHGGALADQVGLIALFAGCFIGTQLVIFVQDNLLDSFARKRGTELREQLLEGVFQTQAQLTRQAGTAGVTQAALDGIDQVETYLRVILPKIVGLAVVPVIVLVGVFVYDWISAIILLVLFPVIIFYMIMLGRLAAARAEAQYASYNQLSNHFVDTLRGIDTLKAFGASRAYGSTIFNTSERFRTATIDTLKVATLSSAVLDLIATVGVAAVAMLLGFRLLNDQMALFNGLAVLVLAPEYFRPIRNFAGDYHASLDGKNALVNITGLIAQARKDGTARIQAALAPWGPDSTLELKGVCFDYRTFESEGQKPDGEEDPQTADGTDAAAEEPPRGQDQAGAMQADPAQAIQEQPDNEQGHRALSDISLRVRGNTKVGIVGASGSGKSTLVGLLGGFNLPSAGTIEIDGRELASLRCDGWQNQMLYIPQDPYIFHATLRDNIAFYTPSASDADIARAVAAVGLDELVASLPQGLDTVIGEGARGLSGGQAHRIALARALLDPQRRILLFDEPTAHLDIETELELKERMLPLMEGRLVLFATHRLHWLSSMDHVVVMDEGRIVEQGSLDDLLAANGHLAQFVQRAQGGMAS